MKIVGILFFFREQLLDVGIKRLIRSQFQPALKSNYT